MLWPFPNSPLGQLPAHSMSGHGGLEQLVGAQGSLHRPVPRSLLGEEAEEAELGL